MLNLTRPLVALDIESTGPKPETDRVIELGIVRLTPDGERTARRWLIHPGREIPAESTKVHGITDADVADAPRFEAVAAEIAAELSGCDLTGYNLRWRDDGDLYVAFGRHDGARLIDMDDGFLRWVLGKDFPADVCALVREVLHGGRPRAPGAPPLPKEPYADSWDDSDDPDDHSREDYDGRDPPINDGCDPASDDEDIPF